MPLQWQGAWYFFFINSYSAAVVGHRRDLLNSLHQRAVSLLQGDDHAAQDQLEWLLKCLSKLVINVQRTMEGTLVGFSKHFAKRYPCSNDVAFGGQSKPFGDEPDLRCMVKAWRKRA